MQNAEMEQILALMNQYAAVLITLNERGVIRTYNSPVGDFAEWLVSQKLGLRLEKNQFDFLIAVIFDSHFQVRAAYQIPHEIIPRYAVYRRHVNGHILLADGPILRDPATKDITHLLR